MAAYDPSTIKALILDMDGVLWREDEPIGDLAGIFARIRSLGWQVSLATNNTTRSVDQYLDKLRRFGVMLEAWQIVTSAHAALRYLQQHFPQGGKIFLIGEKALEEILAENGFINSAEDALAVIVSMDRYCTYEKLSRATLLVRAGAPLLATNPDKTFPTPEGLVPGTGALLAAVVAASGAEAIITGKPEPVMYQIAMERMHSNPASTLVVGDRLETDIIGAQRIGCRTGLVLSGVTSPQAYQEWLAASQAAQCRPDWVTDDLESLLRRFAPETP